MNEMERIQTLADFRETEMSVLALLNAPGMFQNVKTRNNVMYAVQRGDRIERIAKKFNVSVQDIVDLNRLQYPFVDSEIKIPNPGVAVAGQEIMIPTTAGIMESVTMRQVDIEDRKYGTDLEFDFEAGDLIINDSDSDCAMIRGASMIVQQFRIMFLTRVGRLIDFPFYGNPLRIGQLQNAWNIAMDKINMLNALYTDRRIKSASVNSVSGDGLGGTNYQWTVQIGDVEKTGKAERL
jgi:LysM repeat protein